MRLREVRPILFRVLGPSNTFPPLRLPVVGSVAAIIGPDGRPGVDGGVSIQRLAARALSGHRVLKLLDETADYPDLNLPGDGELIGGISAGAAAVGAAVTIQRAGEMTEGSWSWSPGPVFSGVDGLLTQTPPSGAWLRQVAVAVSPDRIVIDLRPSILI